MPMWWRGPRSGPLNILQHGLASSTPPRSTQSRCLLYNEIMVRAMRLLLPVVVIASLSGQSSIASTYAKPADVARTARATTHSAVASRARRAHHACAHVPRLVGLSLSAARHRAARAGCKLQAREAGSGQIVGQQPHSPNLAQPVVRQTPRAGRAGGVGRTVTVWLKPPCRQSADPGPPAGEPLVKRGPTELVSGLFLAGGPPSHSPHCRSGTPSPGTITVTSSATGAVVASDNVAYGQLATIPLAPGTYTIHGTFADAFSNDQPIEAQPRQVTIVAGYTVRQDVVASIK